MMCTHEFEQLSYCVQTHCSGKNLPVELVRSKCTLGKVEV